jgi:hypothetical protein
MNEINGHLERLFRAAAQATDSGPPGVPEPLEERILRNWRQALEQRQVSAMSALVRAGLVCACAVLLFSSVAGLRVWRQSSANEFVGLDTAIRLTLLP